ncbi:RHS repeat-associated protein [Streptomyces candidus]|uniref:RHS repeat-associated protein n=1 Tax=Streptomyces candidus TaxID=67283 RepID=A0A7X0LTH8_9ACTN|nr:RHS repeat-associated protein [Streptomyces candidus]GHH55407.1 hypothetical protein GCM10018773_59750 [Streptomyces candidus]
MNEYRYSPRGVDGTFTEKVPQPYRFAGGYQDPTGLYHLKARYYDPRIGRFTSPDPSGQEQNPYLYAEGDPVNKIDPSGLATGNIGIEACFGICIGIGLKGDGKELHPTVSFGAGSPGVDGGFTADSGDTDSGWSAQGSCGVGPVVGTVSRDAGGWDGGGGVGTAWSTGKCSATVEYVGSRDLMNRY